MVLRNKMSSHWRWFDDANNSNLPRRSPWLQSTIAELDNKTVAMLKLIEEEGDSFAKRAELFYQKRPELISMVEDLYRTHRSLAERYDKLKSSPGICLFIPPESPWSDNVMNSISKCYDNYSETYDSEEESAASEVEDPEEEEEEAVAQVVCHGGGGVVEEEDYEMTKLKEEMERLREENRILKEDLMQKDGEKREVIKQLSLAVNMLKEENADLRKTLMKEQQQQQPQKRQVVSIQLNKMRQAFLGKLFNAPP